MAEKAEKTKKRMGRPEHEPNDKQRKQVEIMAGCGLNDYDIARVLQISAPTLRKWYPVELDTGHLKAGAAVAASLYNKAMGSGPSSVTACIFWLKVRCGWVEPTSSDMPGKKELLQRASLTAAQGTSWEEGAEYLKVN